MKRRDFLKVVVGGAAISLGAEAQRFGKLIPFLHPQENSLPGVATWFATSCRECPAGCGLLVRVREGRAVKVEGNPLHPINAGKTCPRGQAVLQGLYDPDRLTQPLARDDRGRLRETGWEGALKAIGTRLAPLRGTGRIALLTDLQTGSMEPLVYNWLRAFGSDHQLVYEPLNYEPLREANRRVFGRAAIPDYRFDEADLILSLGADFLETWISPVKFIRRFAEGHAVRGSEMSKFIYAGPRLSQTALSADEHFLIAPTGLRELGLALLSALGRDGANRTPESAAPQLGLKPAQIHRLARQLRAARNPLVVAGTPLPAGDAITEAVVAANLLNAALGTRAVDFGRPHALDRIARAEQVAAFVQRLGSGDIQALIIVGANPAYTLSPELRFAEALQQVPVVIHLSPFRDETAELAGYVLPANTPLESWGDYEPERGVRNLMQPVMGTRYATRSVGDLLLQLAEAAGIDLQPTFDARTYRDYLERAWGGPNLSGDSSAPVVPAPAGGPEGLVRPDNAWEIALQRGGTWPAETPSPEPLPPAARQSFGPPSPEEKRALWAYPAPLLYDGRGANKRWLQEIQDPVTHAVWGSWVEAHPDTVRREAVGPHLGVRLTTAAGEVRAPLFHYLGVARGVVAIPLGQGHTAYGRYATARGANAFQLLPMQPRTGAFPELTLSADPLNERLVTTDGAYGQEGRRIVESQLLSRLTTTPPTEITWPLPSGFRAEHDLYAPHQHVGHRWAMVIDLSRCVGCETCMAACYAENNLGVAGKVWVGQGREMYWLRLTRYFDWSGPHSPALFLPMLCQQCDAAPCEPVCPVFAAAHTEEGLNQQVYNRCIGTRYCSNNCPYKVRRFNWRNYDWPESLTWQLNPDVTPRVRGVMEKCTFCVQRIRDAEYLAKREGRAVRDGEIQPACVQACPANVFTFGDLLDPNSTVSRLAREDPRHFQVLQELNTKPAVIYLRKVFNDREPEGV